MIILPMWLLKKDYVVLNNQKKITCPTFLYELYNFEINDRWPEISKLISFNFRRKIGLRETHLSTYEIIYPNTRKDFDLDAWNCL